MTTAIGSTALPPGSPEETRKLLIDAATHEFAAEGVHSASLLEITRQAGQRNRGAVHYHFGSRTGMLVAVLEQQAHFIARRGAELVARAQRQPADDIASCLEAIVRPAVEASAIGPLGCAYLVILAELTDQGPDAHPQEVVDVLTRFNGLAVYELLAERMPSMPDEYVAERTSLIASFLLKTVADRARAMHLALDLAEGGRIRPHLETEPFIANLISMGVAMATAPIPPSRSTRPERGSP